MPAPARPRAAEFRVWLHTLLVCDWCAGVWWSAIVGTLAYLYGHHPAFLVPASILTVAYAMGWLVEHEEQPQPLITTPEDANT